MNRRPSYLAIGIAVAVPVLLGLLVSWFAWPAKELEPRDLPIVVAGPAPAASALAEQLRAAGPGAFEVTTATDAAAADAALRDRQAYAALLSGPTGSACTRRRRRARPSLPCSLRPPRTSAKVGL